MGAFIIALCMLTDNAIVITEGMKVRVESGEDKIAVIRDVVSQCQWPLLGATAIAVVTIMFGLAFACFLTMIVVPVLYAIFFKVQEPSSDSVH